MNPILVALDASPRAPHVLETARGLALARGCKLDVFRAVTIPPEVPAEVFDVSPNELIAVLEKHARDDLALLVKDVPTELVCNVRVGVGTPWHAICRAAKESVAELIVIGSHGYGGIDRLIGTTAAKVVNHAETSVLVVRSRPHA